MEGYPDDTTEPLSDSQKEQQQKRELEMKAEARFTYNKLPAEARYWDREICTPRIPADAEPTASSAKPTPSTAKPTPTSASKSSGDVSGNSSAPKTAFQIQSEKGLEFVDPQGNVFHKGKEQPKLKGTLKPTEPKPPKKKLSKQEKEDLKTSILQQMLMLRGRLKKATFKKDIRSNSSQLKRLERQLKKVR